MIAYRSVMASQGGGGGESAECILKDGMLSDLGAYYTVNLSKSLVVGEIYGLSIKATDGNDPEEQAVYLYNSHPVTYRGATATFELYVPKGTMSNIRMNFSLAENTLTLNSYTGSWQYIWCKLYHYPVPEEAKY